MRFIVIAVAGLVACSPIATSSPTPRATERVTASPSATVAALRYVAIGASDTVGLGATDPPNGSWPARIASRLPAAREYVNYGVSGTLAATALRDQVPPAIAREPTIVTIWLAVNDLNAGVAPIEYARTLTEMLDTLVPRTRATVFVGNVPDLRAVPAYEQADQEALIALINAYNRAIAETAARHRQRVQVVDLFTGSAELTTRFTVSPDGLHPSDEGYKIIAERFLDAMRARGIPLL